MKKIITMVAVALIAGAASADLLVAYDFYGTSRTMPADAPGQTSLSTNLSSALLSRGPGLAATTQANGSNWVANSWSPNSTLGIAITSNDYFQGSVVAAGPDVTVTNIQFTWITSTAVSPTNVTVLVSTDSAFGTYWQSSEFQKVGGALGLVNVSVDPLSNNSGSTVYYRIYAYGSDATLNNTFAGFDGAADGYTVGTANGGLAGFGNNDFVVQGSVVPEPATIAMMGLGGLLALLARRMRK